MIPCLRREELLKFIENKDIAYMQDLADQLNISFSTIRRDMLKLQEEGVVEVMRGGAVRLKKDDYDEPVIRKKFSNSEAKEMIAQKASELVNDGECIYVDSGTTTTAMLKYLSGKKGLTVVSSSTQLTEHMPVKGAKCILLGGEVREDLESTFGSLAEKMILTMYFDKAFIGANGYIEDGGVYTYDMREARKKEMVKENSREVFLLADTSKRNRKAFCKVFDFSDCVLITEESEKI